MSKRKFHTNLLSGMALVRFLEILSNLTHVSSKTADSHLEGNKANWSEYLQGHSIKYIENQHALTMLKYGSYRKHFSKWFFNGEDAVAAKNTCGVISVYNSLLYLGVEGEEASFPYLLNYFEKRSSVLKGYFGTSFIGIIKYFKNNGYDYRYVCGKKITEESLKDIEDNYKTFIFVSYNNIESISDMIHTMSITREAEGFTIHNSGSKPEYFGTLYEAVVGYNACNGIKSRPIAVIGIGDKKSKDNSEGYGNEE